MSIDILIIGVLVIVVGAILYFKKHPTSAAPVTARLDEIAAGLHGRLDGLVNQVSAVHQAALAPVTVVMAPPPAVTPAALEPRPDFGPLPPDVPPKSPGPVVFDPAQGFEAFQAFRARYPMGTDIFSPRGYPIDVRGQEIDPAQYQMNMATRDIAAGQWWGYEFTQPGQMVSPNFTITAPTKYEVIFGFELGRGISAGIVGFGPVAGGDIITLQIGSYQVLLTATHPGSTSFMLNKVRE